MKKVMAIIFTGNEIEEPLYTQYGTVKNYCDENNLYLYSVFELPCVVTGNLIELEQIYNSINKDEVSLIIIPDIKYIEGDPAVYLAPLLTHAVANGIGIESVEDGNLDLIDWASDLNQDDIERVKNIMFGEPEDINSRSYLVVIADEPKSHQDEYFLSEAVSRAKAILKNEGSKICAYKVEWRFAKEGYETAKKISREIIPYKCNRCYIANVIVHTINEDSSASIELRVQKIEKKNNSSEVFSKDCFMSIIEALSSK